MRKAFLRGLLWDPADAKEHGCVHMPYEAGDEDFLVSEADTKCHLQLTIEERRGGEKQLVAPDPACPS